MPGGSKAKGEEQVAREPDVASPQQRAPPVLNMEPLDDVAKAMQQRKSVTHGAMCCPRMNFNNHVVGPPPPGCYPGGGGPCD